MYSVPILSRTFYPAVLACSLCLAGQPTFAEPIKCSTADLHALLPVADPAYADAMSLRQTLVSNGFVVHCVLASKMASLFRGEKGAALFRTNRGDFEALFLPQSKDFNGLIVIEQREDDAYVYSFVGEPRPWDANRIEGPGPTFFVHAGNRLLITQNSQTAAVLDQILNSA